MTKKLLEISNLSVGYGEIQVLYDLSIHLDKGERIGLFGPNGHGKTTLLRSISGLLTPWQGNIMLDGESLVGRSPQAIVEQGVIHVAQGSKLFPRMTVLENLTLGGYSKRARGNKQQNLEKVFDLFPRLAERQRQLCQTLSGGERQMVAIGIGLMGNADLLMLDEPTLGLAPVIREELGAAIGKVAEEGTPLLIVEQDVDFLLALTDRLYLIENGQVALEHDRNDPKLEHNQIMEMYFGNHQTTATPEVQA